MDNLSNILLIDNDNEELMQLVTYMEGKYTLSEVAEGEDLIQAASEKCADLILLDDMMTEPNCYDICHYLKSDEQTQTIPIIIMSDLEPDELESEIGFIGSDDYICKPIKRDELLKKIETLLSFNRVH